MENKDYYGILEVQRTATEEEIKKAYKKLALQYHPDKNPGNDAACEKFKEVAEAYSILGTSDKKKQYDVMGSFDETMDFGGGTDPFSVFNSIFKQHVESFMNMQYENDINIGNIFSNFSGMSQNNFPFGNVHIKVHTFSNKSDDGRKDNLENPYQQSFQNLNNNIQDEVKPPKIIYNKPEDKVYTVKVTYADIYNKILKKVNIYRIRRKDGVYSEKKKTIEIPVYGKEIFLEGEGDQLKDYKERGNVIINIFNKKHKEFKRINEYDMLYMKEIQLADLYKVMIHDIILPHGEVLRVKSENLFLQTHYFQKVLNKGLPYLDEEGKDSQGNLYIMFNVVMPKTVEGLREINVVVEDKREEREPEIVFQQLPVGLVSNVMPLDLPKVVGACERLHDAYGCSINEIFKDE